MEVIKKRKDLQQHQTDTADLSAEALSFTTTFAKPFKLLLVTVHFDAASSNVIEVYKDSGVGTNYDILLNTSTMNGSETDYSFAPAGECIFEDGSGTQDEVLVSIAKAGSCNAYATVEVEEL